MGRRLRLTFVDQGISAVAEMMEAAAPLTCAGVVAALPFAGEAQHAVYSGSEIAFILDRDLDIPMENATSQVIPGDLAFTRFEGGKYYGIPTSFSELCWFYDRDAVPSMPDGPVPVNIFARIVEEMDEFTAVCRRMRREGVKRMEIRLV
jgi:hypothetical protein